MEYRYEKIPKDRYQDVILNLRQSFFPDEPLNKAVGLCKRGEEHADLERYTYEILEEDLSIMAVTPDGEIAGVIINLLQKPGYMDDLDTVSDTLTDPPFTKLFAFLSKETKDFDFFKKFNVQRIMEIYMLSVDPKHRQQGISKMLVKETIELAKENNIEMIKNDASGINAQHVFISLGFTVYKEKLFSEIFDENNELYFKVDPPNKSFMGFYMLLNS